MQYKMFTIWDSCARVYQRPFIARVEGEATRSFADVANDKAHPIGQHPEHYSLYEIASFDDADAEIKQLHKRCIAHAHELVRENPNGDLFLDQAQSPGGTK